MGKITTTLILCTTSIFDVTVYDKNNVPSKSKQAAINRWFAPVLLNVEGRTRASGYVWRSPWTTAVREMENIRTKSVSAWLTVLIRHACLRQMRSHHLLHVPSLHGVLVLRRTSVMFGEICFSFYRPMLYRAQLCLSVWKLNCYLHLSQVLSAIFLFRRLLRCVFDWFRPARNRRSVSCGHQQRNWKLLLAT